MRRGPALPISLGLAASLGIALLATLAVAGPAWAHNQVVSSTPRSGQTLTELPAQFSIVTNESLLDIGGQGRGFAFQIRDSAGRYYETGCVSITDATMTTPARLGAPGAYTVIFQLVSQDGHTVSGEIPFRWAPGAAVVPSPGSTAPASCPGSSAPPAQVAEGTGSEAARDSTVPLADVLWVGGVLLVVAIAVVVTLVVVARRRGDEHDDGDGNDSGPPASP